MIRVCECKVKLSFYLPGTIDSKFCGIARSSCSIGCNARIFPCVTGTRWINGQKTVSLGCCNRNWWNISIDRNAVECPRNLQWRIATNEGAYSRYRFAPIHRFVCHFEGSDPRRYCWINKTNSRPKNSTMIVDTQWYIRCNSLRAGKVFLSLLINR